MGLPVADQGFPRWGCHTQGDWGHQPTVWAIFFSKTDCMTIKIFGLMGCRAMITKGSNQDDTRAGVALQVWSLRLTWASWPLLMQHYGKTVNPLGWMSKTWLNRETVQGHGHLYWSQARGWRLLHLRFRKIYNIFRLIFWGRNDNATHVALDMCGCLWNHTLLSICTHIHREPMGRV